MANRYPLILDTTDGNKIKELPEGDNLYLRTNSITGVQNIDALGTINAADITIGGQRLVAQSILDLTDTPSSFSGQANQLLKVSTDETSIDFVSLSDIGDITAGTITITGGILPDADGTGSIGSAGEQFSEVRALDLYGNLRGYDGTLIFNATANAIPYAAIAGGPTSLSEFINDTGYVTQAQVDASLAAGITISDFKGSVFGDDSTLLVDAVASRINPAAVYGELGGPISVIEVDTPTLISTNYLTITTEGDLFTQVIDIEPGGVTSEVNITAPNITITGNINNRLTLVAGLNSSANITAPTFTGDFIGSVFADDSTMLFDATDGKLKSPTISGTATFEENIVIQGNLTVQGTTTSVETTNTTISDNIIVLNQGELGAGITAGTSGIEIERGSLSNVQFVYNDAIDKWTIGSQTLVAATFEGNLLGNVTGNVTGDTSGTHTGGVIGNVTGNVNGNITGDVTGSVFADDSTLLVDGVGGNIFGNVEATRLRTTDSTIALGIAAGETNQGGNTIAIGAAAGQTNQGTSSIAIGGQAGATAQAVSAVAVGTQSGTTNQGAVAVAVGTLAGTTNQGLGAVAVGGLAGNSAQGNYAVALGYLAGSTTQSNNAVAIGNQAGNSAQGNSAVAVGDQAGRISQGDYAVAIGDFAGYENQSQNSIVINATGSELNNTTASSFVVKPVREAVGTTILMYDATSGEITHTSTPGSITTDITGSVFGDDSTLIIDGTNNTVYGTFVGDIIGDMTGDPVLTLATPGDAPGEIINIAPGGSANFVNLVATTIRFFGATTAQNNLTVLGTLTTNKFIGTGDLTGSVFGDDSTLLVDGVNNVIPSANISGTEATQWNTAYSWGDHSTQGYLTSIPTAITADLTGSVFADDSTLLVDAVNGEIPGYVKIADLKTALQDGAGDYAAFKAWILANL